MSAAIRLNIPAQLDIQETGPDVAAGLLFNTGHEAGKCGYIERCHLRNTRAGTKTLADKEVKGNTEDRNSADDGR